MRGDTLWQRLTRGACRARQQPDWQDWVGPGWADQIMSVTVTDNFHAKQGRSTGRWVLESGGRRLGVYLKRHYRLPWWRGWLAALRPGAGWSPALGEWRHLEWARAQGLPVPRPVAAAEYVGPWGGLQSVLAVEELTDMLPLHEAIPRAAAALPPGAFARWKRGLARELARLTARLHGLGRYHRDLYLCHFFIPAADTGRLPDAWAGRVYLIDLHRLARRRWLGGLARAKDLAQLLFSSELPGIVPRDRAAFWRHYRRAARPCWAAGLLRRLVLWKFRLYQRHNQKVRDVGLGRPVPAPEPGSLP